MRKSFASLLLASVAGLVVVVGGASPAAAFQVQVAPTTVAVTQTEAADLLVVRTAAGTFEVSAGGGPATTYPARDNLTVRLVNGPAYESATVVLDSSLAGSLNVSIAGPHGFALKGAAASIGVNLQINGDGAQQDVVLGDAGQPVTAHGAMAVNLVGGADTFTTNGALSCDHSLVVRGANGTRFLAPLTVVENLTFESFNDGLDTSTALTTASIGGSLVVNGFDTSESIVFNSPPGPATIGRNVLIQVGNNIRTTPQVIDVSNTDIAGELRVSTGTGPDALRMDADSSVGTVIGVKLGDDLNSAIFAGSVSGEFLKYVGGIGTDQVSVLTNAPTTQAIIKTDAGSDSLTVAGGTTVLLKLIADLGPDVDTFDAGGYVLPPGSSVTNVP